jgi:hypothetical protein
VCFRPFNVGRMLVLKNPPVRVVCGDVALGEGAAVPVGSPDHRSGCQGRGDIEDLHSDGDRSMTHLQGECSSRHAYSVYAS